jgi:hypothetical protein
MAGAARPTSNLYYNGDTRLIGNTPGYQTQTGWREWFAQSMAIQASSDTGATSNIPQLDQIVGSGFMGCIAGTNKNGLKNGWLAQVYATGANAINPCATQLPADWTDIQNTK